jgi:pilus assembly protein CpaC
LVTRRAETTVELGSGQSFMIAGLLQNTTNNSINKAPLLGDMPIIGMLFRSTKFQRQETELVVIVTPYLVRPVSGQLASPTNGFRVPDDVQRDVMGQTFTGVAAVPTANAVQYPSAASAPPAALAAPAPAPGFKL